MPRGFIGNYTLIKLDASKAISRFHRTAVGILKEAVRAWVASAESNIPSWSGMSRGALVKLAGLVGENVSTHTAPSAIKRIGNRRQLGEAQSSASLIKKRGRYGFTWKSNVFHLAVNENVDATQFGFRLIRPGPYNFRDKANAAFQKVVEDRLSSFPFPREAITSTVHKVG